MKALTIYDIKKLSSETSPYYFSKDTLEFFGQTMKDFKVTKVENKNIYKISAKSFDTLGQYMGDSVQYFNPVNNQLNSECK